MSHLPKDRRNLDRAYVEPYTTNTFLEFSLCGRTLQCPLLDVSPGGLGMLVQHTEKEILPHPQPGAKMSMAYTPPQATVPVRFEIRHVTEIKQGKLSGHFQVGLNLVSEDNKRVGWGRSS